MQIKPATLATNANYQQFFFFLVFNVVETLCPVAKAIQGTMAVNVHWVRLETLPFWSNPRSSWHNFCFAFEEGKLISEELHIAR